MEQLSFGVVARSRERDEYRVAIHPEHLGRIDAELRRRIFLERGYGEWIWHLGRRARSAGRRPALARAAHG